MRGKLVMYQDQYGQCFWAKSIRELCGKVGRKHVSKMYIDGTDGKSYHIGYVVGRHWCTAYVPVRIPT